MGSRVTGRLYSSLYCALCWGEGVAGLETGSLLLDCHGRDLAQQCGPGGPRQLVRAASYQQGELTWHATIAGCRDQVYTRSVEAVCTTVDHWTQ